MDTHQQSVHKVNPDKSGLSHYLTNNCYMELTLKTHSLFGHTATQCLFANVFSPIQKIWEKVLQFEGKKLV